MRYNRAATDALAEIHRYVLDQSKSRLVAERFVRRVKARCERIGDAPHAGRPRDELRAGLRVVPFEHSAVIAYMVESDIVRIVNIFHGGRDYEALLGGRGP